ncbi:MAG: response regulator transcription factor [Caldilineaceae bacterium]|nr:response regulator transcription factor [Caldilineaceae bacterium]
MATQNTVKVMIVETNDFVRFGLEASFRQHGEWELMGIFSSPKVALELSQDRRPDILLVDVASLDSGWPRPADIVRTLRTSAPNVRIIFWVEREAPELLAEVLLSDADGYLSKDVGMEELLSSMRQIWAGRRVLNSRLTLSSLAPYVNAKLKRSDADRVLLTPRELEVLKLLAMGQSNDEIATQLGIQASTASVHVSHIITKLNAENRTHAVLRAAELGFTEFTQSIYR